MTRTGRIVAALGAVASGFIVASCFSLLVRQLFHPTSLVVALVVSLVGGVIFAVTVAAAYTWTVNGPFVFRRNRSRFARKKP